MRGDWMIKPVTLLIVAVFGIIWIIISIRRLLKLPVKRRASSENDRNSGPEWETGDCICGIPRIKWKVIDMNHDDKRLLLTCPQCKRLWEEQMSVRGSKWRQVDETHAKGNYTYNEQRS